MTYANVMATIAVFLVLSGGTAVALNGGNTVFTDDIANDTQPASGGNPAGGLVAADLRPNSVGGSEAANDSLTGTDVNEATLGQVPSALLGGFGRSVGDGSCDPEGASYLACSVVTRDLPAQARLLLIGHVNAQLETGSSISGSGSGFCRIGTTAGALLETQTRVLVQELSPSQVTLAGVTGPLGPGQPSFGIDCNEESGNIEFKDADIVAVAISPA
jgi:hypothetical protein